MRQEQKDNMLFAYMRSIDKSLGRIATALEDMQKQQGTKTYAGTDDDGNDIYVWHPGKTVKETQPIDHDDLR